MIEVKLVKNDHIVITIKV